MKKMKTKFIIICALYMLITSCDNDGRGYEFMPNMYRSPSLETYGKNNVFSDSLNARQPVKGTIARGYLKTFNYGSNLQGYLLAGQEVINPLELSFLAFNILYLSLRYLFPFTPLPNLSSLLIEILQPLISVIKSVADFIS